MQINMKHISPMQKQNKNKKEFHLNSDDLGFISAGISNVVIKETPDVSCLVQTDSHLSTSKK